MRFEQGKFRYLTDALDLSFRFVRDGPIEKLTSTNPEGAPHFFSVAAAVQRVHSDFDFKVSGEGLIRSPVWMNLYCAAWFRSTSAISQRALLSFISSSMPLIALLLGIRLPSERRRERSR